MTTELDLSLPKKEQPSASRSGKGLYLLAAAVLAAVLANIWITVTHGGPGSGVQQRSGALSSDGLKQLALKLEDQGLDAAAVETWKEYISAAGARDDEAAQIWYRVGTLRQKDRDYAGALDGYYRSESFGKIESLASEIARRTQECLEAMGKFSALRNELNDRVSLVASSNASASDIVAEIGAQKITRADLDRRIEALIDRQLSGSFSQLPEDERNMRKEEMLKQLASPSRRLELLNGLVVEEVLYRRAGELKLSDNPAVHASLQDLERSRLAQMVVERELADGIKITEGDLTTWYEAHKKEYVQPERAAISHILVADEDAAKDVLRRLEAGEEFEKLAAELSMDESTAKGGGRISDWARKGLPIPGISGAGDEATAAVFGTGAGKVASAFVKTDGGCHVIKVREREPEQQKTFDEVKTDVYRRLRAGKEKEVQEKMFSELRDRYNVVIHQSAFPGAEEEQEK